MKIRLNKLHFPVTSLGPGKRICIWLQGCSIGCPGCVSQDTWSAREDFLVDVNVIIDWCRNQPAGSLDGITISGGEPFEQARALTELLDSLIEWRHETNQSIDILCYSGLPFARLQRDFSDILLRLDAIIPEPYVDTLPDKALWRGSSNQTLVPLSDLGQMRYASFVNATAAEKGDFQVMVQADRVWFIGIPARGDMKKLEQACRARGVIQGDVSWRA